MRFSAEVESFPGMESLETAVSATCPLGFAGASGPLFVKAVTALVAAHCGILDDHQWPNDEAEEMFSNGKGSTFDFIIVGAGTAGSIIASRLNSNFPLKSILLIEAGGDPGLDSEIPGLLFLNQNTDIDWHYQTYPDGRSCLGFNNNSCTWSKGRAMGGSNSINAMLYIRGHSNDYDKWKEDGNSKWSYNNLKPFFEKIESNLNLDNSKNAGNLWYDIVKAAWNELNLNFVNNSDEAQTGTRITKLLTKDGKRLNAAKIYLSDRANLHVIKKTTVQKIIIDLKTNTATGVEIRHSSGEMMEINVNNEIILSAGSIATPQILMLSGIGTKEHLEENNIQCLVELPVGKNLQDHVLLPIFLKTNLHTHLSSKDLSTFLLQYMIGRTGPFSNIGITDFMGFIDTENAGYPDIQFHHTHFTQNDSFTLKPYLKGVGYNEGITREIEKLNEQSDLLGIYPTLLHPKSRGEILLANADPKSIPIIKSNYFHNPKDIESLIKGVSFIQNLTVTNTFKALDIKLAILNIPLCQKSTFEFDEYWECYIRYMATTIYHAVGTAKMGSKDNGGVVNEDLLVHGMNNLRVVDASVMPTLPSGNTMAPTMAIAEKASAIITDFYNDRFKDEL